MLAVICGLQYEDTKLSQVILHVANALGLWSSQQESPSGSTSHDDQRCRLCHPDDLVDAASVGTTSFPSEAQEGYTCPHCTCCQLMFAHSVQINAWLAAALRTYRDSVPPALHGKTFAIYSWNVTGLRDMQTPIGKTKLRKSNFG